MITNYQSRSKNKEIKNSGCYFYCLIVAANRNPEEAETLYNSMIEKGFMKNDCYILDPCKILSELTNQNYKVINSKNYDQKAEIKIAKWHNSKTGYSHFVLMKNETEVLFDSFGHSNTVKNGFIESWRLFYKL